MAIDKSKKPPLAPDGKEYFIERRYVSLFRWGRPPIPASAADQLSQAVNDLKIASAVVAGSCCPSVVTAIGFGDEERTVKMIDMRGVWDDGWNHPSDSVPPRNWWLPHKKIFALGEWRWRPQQGDMLFSDAPWDKGLLVRESEGEYSAYVLESFKPRLVALGFYEGISGPQELERLLRAGAWEMREEIHDNINVETEETRSFRLLLATPR